jgi:hypothetical protein
MERARPRGNQRRTWRSPAVRPAPLAARALPENCPFSICIAFSRVVLGVHYPSDVAAAAVIGGALGAGSLSLF